jgi:hypothetical protein
MDEVNGAAITSRSRYVMPIKKVMGHFSAWER